MRYLTAILGFILCTVTTIQAEQKLRLFIWSEYIDPVIIEEFEKKFNAKVTVDLYEDNESMLAKLKGGGASQYDVVVPSDYIIPALVKLDLIAPLDATKIPNMGNIDPKFKNPPYDPKQTYTVPYQWGTVGIFMRKKEGETIDETWGLLFDKAKQPGPFVFIDSMREAIGAGLRYHGYPLNVTDTEALTKVRETLIDTKNRAVALESGVGGRNRVLAGTARAAIAYSGDALKAISEDPETYYFVPREGGEIWVDNLAVTRSAPNSELAHAFINYILDAKVGAQLSNYNQYATPNKASMEFISAEDRANTAIYPTAEMMSKLDFSKDLGADSRIYDALWTAVKAG
jgi:spermidine/putrescine transport system substrate-binding protein